MCSIFRSDLFRRGVIIQLIQEVPPFCIPIVPAMFWAPAIAVVPGVLPWLVDGVMWLTAVGFGQAVMRFIALSIVQRKKITRVKEQRHETNHDSRRVLLG
jgi:hypothetical protein